MSVRGVPLSESCPEIAVQWHPERNGELTAAEVSSGSKLKVWWRCERDHDFDARVDRRSAGDNCPYCSGKRTAGERSLAALHPDLAAQWHPDRNGELTAEAVTPSSKKRVWWRCEHGHEWDAPVYARKNGNGCPYCSGRRVMPEGSLAVLFPAVARQWAADLNGSLNASEVHPTSHKLVWWRCRNGHEWQARIASRTRPGDGCPACAVPARAKAR